MLDDKTKSKQQFEEAQIDRFIVKKSEVKFLTPEEVSERLKKNNISSDSKEIEESSEKK